MSITIALIVSDYSHCLKKNINHWVTNYVNNQDCDLLVLANGRDSHLQEYIETHFSMVRYISYDEHRSFANCFNDLLSLIYTQGLMIVDATVTCFSQDLHREFSMLKKTGNFAGIFPVIQRDQSVFNRRLLRGCYLSRGFIENKFFASDDNKPRLFISEAMVFQTDYLKSLNGCVTGYYSVEFMWYDIFYRAMQCGWKTMLLSGSFCEKVSGINAFFSFHNDAQDERVDRWVFLCRYVRSLRYLCLRWVWYWITLFSFRPRQLSSLVVSIYLRLFYYIPNKKRWSLNWVVFKDKFLLKVCA